MDECIGYTSWRQVRNTISKLKYMFSTLFDSIFIFINHHNTYINSKNVLADGVMKTVTENRDSLNAFFFIIKKEFEKSTAMKNQFIFNFNMASGLHKLIISSFLWQRVYTKHFCILKSVSHCAILRKYF